MFSICYEKQQHILVLLLRFHIHMKPFHDNDDDDRSISERQTI